MGGTTLCTCAATPTPESIHTIRKPAFSLSHAYSYHSILLIRSEIGNGILFADGTDDFMCDTDAQLKSGLETMLTRGAATLD